MAILDAKDRKLLYHLSLDARTSDTLLAKKIGLSKNAVKYRTERLLKNGIIKNFAAVVNLGAIKYTTITLLLKFNEDIYEKTEIIEYFKNNEFADWVISLSGQWDIFVELAIKDFTHLDKMMHEIISHFGTQLNTYRLFFSSNTLRVEHLIADFYKDLYPELTPELTPKQRTAEKHDIDETDKSILHLLNQNSILPYHTIAQRLGLTMDVVRYRVRSLLNKGIIVKFFPEISLPKLGYTEYLYTIRLKNVSQERMDSIKKRIQANENVTYAFFDTTGFNLIFVCAFKTAEGIDHLSRSIRKQYSDMVEEQEYLIIKEQILFNLFPKGILSA